MIGRIWAIALNTFREASRNRILYGIVAVVLGLNLFATVLGEMSLHEEARVARDVGLGGVALFGSITAIILGVSLLHGEVQRRTIQTIIAKPLYRFEFVLGKYLGMVLTLTVLVFMFTLAMALLLHLQDVPFDADIAKAVILSYVEVLLVAAIAVFFSSFSSPYLSGIFTFGIFFLGRVTPEMREALGDDKLGPVSSGILGVGINILPDLNLFSVSGATVKGEHVSVHTDFVGWDYVATTVGYGFFYLTALLLLAVVIFSRRDFA